MSRLKTKTIATIIALMIVTGCGNKEQKAGTAFAEAVLERGMQDADVEERYRAATAGYTAEQRADFDEGVSAAIDEDETDSVPTMLRVLIHTAKDLGRKLAEDYSEKVIDGKMTAQELERYVDLLEYMGRKTGRAEYGKDLIASMQEYIDSMPMERQMRVYALSSTPRTMGIALKAALNQAEADTVKVKRQVAELRKIYTDEEYREFSQIYNK